MDAGRRVDAVERDAESRAGPCSLPRSAIRRSVRMSPQGFGFVIREGTTTSYARHRSDLAGGPDQPHRSRDQVHASRRHGDGRRANRGRHVRHDLHGGPGQSVAPAPPFRSSFPGTRRWWPPPERSPSRAQGSERTTIPPFITNRTSRTAWTSRVGSPRTATRSARRPVRTEPRRSSR